MWISANAWLEFQTNFFMRCEIFSVIIDGNCQGKKRKYKRIEHEERPMDAIVLQELPQQQQ